MRTSSRYLLVSVVALLAGVLLCAASWVWADHVYRAGTRMLAYWIGVVGSACPALALGVAKLWLDTQGGSGQAGRAPAQVRALLWASACFLAFMVVFPLL